MFYLWTFIAVLLLFSIYGQTFIIFHGYIPNISVLIISLALLVAVSGMAYRKYTENHKYSKSLENLGNWLLITGFFILINRSNYMNLATFIRGLEFATLSVIPGFMLIFYNRKGIDSESLDIFKEENNNYDLFEVVYLFEQITEYKRINKELEHVIGNCVNYLIVIEQNQYLINNELVKLLIHLLEDYIEITELTVQTQRTETILERIECMFFVIERALEQAYNYSIQSQIEEAEINLKVLEVYLKGQDLKI